MPEPSSGLPLRLWVIGVIGAVALHVACVALAVASLPSDDESDDLGAPAMEIGLDLAAPRAEPSDLPPGPESEASAASPEMREQKEEVKESEAPKDIPNEAENPDRIVSNNESKKPVEEEPKETAKPQEASTASAASEATAMPTSESRQEAERSVAPVQGVGESAQRIKATWQKQLVAHLDRHKRYPAGASRKTIHLVVSFTLDRSGRILSSSIVTSSGDPAFDEAALAMLKRSDPVPMPPPVIADDGLTFTLPVNFRVRG